VSETQTATLDIDTVRIDADGYVLVAGRSAPGETITAVVDGVDMTSITSEADGNFVLMFDIPPADTARILALRLGQGDRAVYAGQDIVIAPTQVQTVASDSVADPAADSTQDEGASEEAAVAETASSQAQGDDSVETMAQTDAPASDTEMRVSSNSAAVETTVDETSTKATDTAQAPSDDTNTAQVATIVDDASETMKETEKTITESVAQVAEVIDTITTANDPDATEAQAVSTQMETTPAASADAAGAAEETVETTAEPASAEPQQPTVFVADTQGVKVIQSADTVAQEQVVLDAISYDETGGVRLSGRGAAASGINLYLDNALTLSTRSDDQGFWSVDGSQIAAGVYTLRIDQIDDGGKVTSRFETPFKREERRQIVEAVQPTVTAEASTQSDDTTSQPQATPEISAITVQPGNTLWGISRERYGEGILYVRVFEANRDKIRNPDLIYPGQVFVLPEGAEQN
jgi:nucleoid-associated protein YgaU